MLPLQLPWDVGPLILCAMVGMLAECASEEPRFARHGGAAESFIEQGRPNEALIELRSALPLRPNHAETNFRIGLILEPQNRPADRLNLPLAKNDVALPAGARRAGRRPGPAAGPAIPGPE